MSIVLYGVGAVVAVIGAVMIAFGIPVNEFSFGNTLISAGVTAVVGGLVIVALAAVSSQLQRLNIAMTDRTPNAAKPFETAANEGVSAAPARVPFPPKTKASFEIPEPELPEPHSGPVAADTVEPEELHASPFAPMLRNPEETPVTVEDDVSLSPPHPMAGRGPTAPSRQPPPFQFESMWPESTPAQNQGADIKPSAEAATAAPPPRRFQQEAAPQRTAPEPSGIAILKSGVVDGMGYTLYVDGSIEAELPQGTLRFASINDLRGHLAKNS